MRIHSKSRPVWREQSGRYLVYALRNAAQRRLPAWMIAIAVCRDRRKEALARGPSRPIFS